MKDKIYVRELTMQFLLEGDEDDINIETQERNK